MQQLTLTLDMNVLNHLGIGLYASAPAVLTELVANAWDADAREVRIQLDVAAGRVDISDDGHGMSKESIQTKFLTVGYARREKEGTDKSSNLQRPVMGRKGIGKLSMFSLAQRIDVFSRQDGAEMVSAAIDVARLQEHIRAGRPYVLKPADEAVKPEMIHGTALVLRSLSRDIGKTPACLIERIARRFSIIGAAQGFEVNVNGHRVSLADRGFYKDVQFFGTSMPPPTPR